MLINRFNKGNSKNVLSIFLLCVLLSAITSCDKEKGSNNKIPKIKFNGLSADSIQSGGTQAITMNFNFSDDNGDLGNTDPGKFDIYTIDNRDKSEINYFFPKDIAETADPVQGISGDCNISLQGAFIILRPDHPLRDTVRYEVYIKDKEGNESNHFTTPDIYILP